jgi:hypothetical protein
MINPVIVFIVILWFLSKIMIFITIQSHRPPAERVAGFFRHQRENQWIGPENKWKLTLK